MFDFNSSWESFIAGVNDVISDLQEVKTGGDTDGKFLNMPYVGADPIVEEDSNANGKYVKYASGLMICHHKVEATTVSNDGQIGTTGIYYHTMSTQTFPHAFVAGSNEASISMTFGSQRLLFPIGVSVETITATEFTPLVLTTASGTTTTHRFWWVAVGRYK